MEKLQGKYPQIRFPEFKDAWDHRKLSELLSESKKRNEGLKFTKDDVLSVSGELGIVNQIEHLGRSYAGVSVHNYHVVDIGDIVYTKSPLKANPFGIIKLNKGKAGIVSTLYAVYKVNAQNACGEFIDNYFSLDANTNRYLRPLVKKGAKNDMKINNAYVLHDRIYTPSIEEQKRIASFFSVLDKKITELKQKKSLLENYKKGIIQKIFSQEVKFKDDRGNEFPKWEKQKLGDYLVKYEEKTTENNQYPVLTSSRRGLFLQKDYFDGNDVASSDTTGYNVVPRNYFTYRHMSDDISFKFNINTICDKGIVSTLYPVFTTKNINDKFLLLKLNEDLEFKKYAYIQKQGGSRTYMYFTKLSDLYLNLPSLPEQEKIADFLMALIARIKLCQEQIDEMSDFKKGTLQQMFC
jgi:type I restriction enzyme S subunit